MIAGLKDLKAACRATSTPKDAEKLNEGESLWLLGYPAPADDGQVALAMGDGRSVIVSESSVLEIKKDDALYLVRVKSLSSALVRFEAVTTLRSEPCRCADTPAPAAASKRVGSGSATGGTGPIIPGCFQCEVEMFCDIYIGKDKRFHKVCVPAPVCKDICDGGSV